MVGKKSGKALLREEGMQVRGEHFGQQKLTTNRPRTNGQQYGNDELAHGQSHKSKELLYRIPEAR